MLYRLDHIRRLHDELTARHGRLLDELPYRPGERAEHVEIDSVGVRVAVDDFKAILAEIRRLK